MCDKNIKHVNLKVQNKFDQPHNPSRCSQVARMKTSDLFMCVIHVSQMMSVVLEMV